MIYLTSDLHLYHNRDFLYGPRGFDNIYDHAEAVIENWNNTVDMNDEVFVLGDLMLNDNDSGIRALKNLKGNIHIVRGNHDTDERIKLYNDCYNVVEIVEGKFLKYGKYHFYLSHYPTLTANSDDGKPLKARMISLCGHSHVQDPFADFDKGLIYHVELDAHRNTPVSIDYIIEDIKNKLEQERR